MTNSLNRRSTVPLAIIAILLPALGLGACGQKGPLYLPGNPSEIKTEVPKQESPQEPQRETPTSEPQAGGEADEDDEEDAEDRPE